MRLVVSLFLLLSFTLLVAQEQPKEKTFIMNDVRTWKLTNMFTYADTLPVDTATNLHQINNPLYRQSVGWVTTGNIGAPAQSLFYPDIKRFEGNIFLTPLVPYIESAEDYIYYNTKTPYANFTYQNGYPKRRSEEYVHVLFTQNVNRRVNIGAKLAVRSSVGRYEAQRTNHVDFRLHGSYNGDYYSGHGSVSYHKAKIEENGGVLLDDYIINSGDYDFDKAEDVPVKMMDGVNRTSLYRIFYTHSMDLAHVERMDTDSVAYEVPVATCYHTFNFETSHREFKVSDMELDYDNLKMIFPNNYADDVTFDLYDTQRTGDSIRYFNIKNVFQVKLAEEFNSLLRFGLRVFIENNIRRYQSPDGVDVVVTTDKYGNDVESIHYRDASKDTEVTTSIGGEIFKHRGDNLSFNAMAKLYIQGYRVGDLELDGKVKTMFNILGTKASVWGSGHFELRSPERWENYYTSNLYRWSEILDNETSMTIMGGLRFDDWNTELMGFSSTIDNKIYYASDGKPRNASSAVEVVGAQLKFHLQGAGFNTINRCAVQHTTDESVVAVPLFVAYSSNFFEHRFFDVLTLQLGFDLQYSTAFYAPRYNPATMQFCSQIEQTIYDSKGEIIQERRKVGNYPYLDPFLNMQIKRVRVYFKYSHVNSQWGNTDHFMTVGYPTNPQSMKFGLSWNFYD